MSSATSPAPGFAVASRFIVPRVLMLVRGSAGDNSVLRLVTDRSISGITAGFDTFATAISIAYALMVST